MTETMIDKWLDADWDLFAMGALEESTQREMQAHLRAGCLACRRSYEVALATMTSLAAAAPQVDPPVGMADTLLKRIAERSRQAEEQNSSSATSARVIPMKQSRTSPRVERPRWSWLPWTIAAVFALLALWFGVRLKQVERIARSTPPAVKIEPVSPAGHAPPAIVPEPAKLDASAKEQAADKQKIQELKLQLAQAEGDRDRAMSEVSHVESQLAAAATERGSLETQLAAAQQAARTANDEHEGQAAQARVADLTRELAKANATIAGLRAVAARDGQVLAFLRDGPTKEIDLKRIDLGAGEASVVAYYSADRGLLLLARDLPRLQDGKCYQVWSTQRSGAAVQSVGLIQTEAGGTGYLLARASKDLRQLTGLAITDEPNGGSVSARGRKLLFGAVN